MAGLSLSLPSIGSRLDDEKERRQIRDYLYSLNEQLRYVLSNLDEDNLSEGLSSTIEGAYSAAAEVSREMEDAKGNISRITQFADSLTLSVSNGYTSSTIALMAGGVSIASSTISMSGMVSFSSLSSPGQTVINGDNITTGTVAASRIDVNNLYVRHLNAADGTFTGTLSGVNGTFSGSLSAVNGSFSNLSAAGGSVYLYSNYINISGVRIGYVSGYNDISVLSNGYAVGNVGVGSLPWSQCVAQYLYSSGGSVGSYSQRSLKRDIAPFSAPGAIEALEPVTYIMRDDVEGTVQIGFIADDIKEICPYLVREFKDESMTEGVLTLDYSRVSVLLVDELKRLGARVARLEEANGQAG